MQCFRSEVLFFFSLFEILGTILEEVDDAYMFLFISSSKNLRVFAYCYCDMCACVCVDVYILMDIVTSM